MRRTSCFAILLSLLAFPVAGHSQLCNGSLGDPVVFIDFGKGAAGPLAAGVTTYTYQAYQQGTCPNDGMYTITSSLQSCFGNTWHNLMQDHTPNDQNGNMMVVNASVTPDDFFVYPVSGLCGATTYEFSAWIANVLLSSSCNGNGQDPNITFRIETSAGQVLGTYSTGPIPESATAQWKQYGMYFTTPSGTSNVVIRMTNNAPGGCGNDVALDDISFRPCGPPILAQVTGSSSASIDLCINNTRAFDLTGNTGGFADPAWQWQESADTGKTWKDIPGQDQASITVHPVTAGIHMYRVSAAERLNIGSASCRIASNQVTIHIHPLPVPSIQATTPVCYGSSWQLQASGGASWEWSGPGGFHSTEQNPVLTAAFEQTGTYTLKAVSDKGCEAVTSASVTVHPTPATNAGSDQTICAGNTAEIRASGSGSYSWTSSSGGNLPASSTLLVAPADSTEYYLTITNSSGCSRSDTVAIHVNRPPAAEAGPDLTILEGDTARIRATVTGAAVSVRWTPASYIADETETQARVFPPQNASYRLLVTSGTGCGAASDEVFIRVLKKPVIPNSFSPNGDGVNDTWKIEQLENYTGAYIEVFNRHGQKVFSSRQYSIPWDGRLNGRPLPAGTYYYVIALRSGMPALNGWLLLVR